MSQVKRTVEDAVRDLLVHVGEDPYREGLLDTPKRVAKALKEMTVGYSQDPAEILSTSFEAPYDQMVILRDIDFVSMCEHHMLPFVGKATVGYIPEGRVVGLSKLARLVQCFAKRLQIQERMTEEIADAISKHLDASGCGVVIEAHHQCMSCRGVKLPNARMVTSALHGKMLQSNVRSEFMSLAGI